MFLLRQFICDSARYWLYQSKSIVTLERDNVPRPDTVRNFEELKNEIINLAGKKTDSAIRDRCLREMTRSK